MARVQTKACMKKSKIFAVSYSVILLMIELIMCKNIKLIGRSEQMGVTTWGSGSRAPSRRRQRLAIFTIFPKK